MNRRLYDANFDKLLCTLAFTFCNEDFCLVAVVPVKYYIIYVGYRELKAYYFARHKEYYAV